MLSSKSVNAFFTLEQDVFLGSEFKQINTFNLNIM